MKQPGILARSLDYRRLALGRQTVTGQLSLKQLPRLKASIDSTTDVVVGAELSFTEDSQRRVRVHGLAAGDLMLECQRCLESFACSVTADVAGVVVEDDESAASVPREDEPIMAEEGVLDAHALIDDELLLALPLVARCNRPTCRADYMDDELAHPAVDEEKPNPFAVLESLKRDSSS